jgi:hypothetical protein
MKYYNEIDFELIINNNKKQNNKSSLNNINLYRIVLRSLNNLLVCFYFYSYDIDIQYNFFKG